MGTWEHVSNKNLHTHIGSHTNLLFLQLYSRLHWISASGQQLAGKLRLFGGLSPYVLPTGRVLYYISGPVFTGYLNI